MSDQSTFLPPILMLHGWGGTFEQTFMSSGIVELFRSHGREVLEIDLPGHGLTSTETTADFDDLSGTIHAKLEHKNYDVVGFSLGAKLALSLAIRYPELFRKVVAGGVGNNIFSQQEPFGAKVAHVLLSERMTSSDPVVNGLINYALDAGNNAKKLAQVLLRKPNPIVVPSQLAQVKSEVCLILGDQDALANPFDQLTESLPSAALHLLKGVDHIQLPHHAEFKNITFEFLQQQCVVHKTSSN